MDTVSVDLVEELSPLISKIENSWRCINALQLFSILLVA